MYPMDDFINRNKDTYIKISDVPSEIIKKYKNIAPDELIHIWEQMGFGIYENGFLQIINPDEYMFVYEYIDLMLEPTILWGITALGDILAWEGKQNATISVKEGDRCYRIDVRKCSRTIVSNMEGLLNVFIGREFFLKDKDYFDSTPYLEVKDELPRLEYGQCYGYVPALALGGRKGNKNLNVVDAKSYIEIIGQAVGKIVDLGR